MKRTQIFIVLLFVIFMLMLTSTPFTDPNGVLLDVQKSQVDLETVLIGKFTEYSEPVFIDGNSELHNKTDQGNGTELDPYLITNLNVNAGGVDLGISIQNTDKYLLIDNCMVSDSGEEYGRNAGIMLNSCQNVRIENCFLIDNYYGISLYSSSNNFLINNSAIENEIGIELDNSPNNQLIQNNATNNIHHGIFAWDSSNNLFINNTVMNNDYGFLIRYNSDHNQFINNLVRNNSYWGIDLDLSSQNNQLTGNTVIENDFGVLLEYDSNNNHLINNIIMNNDLGIWLDSSSNSELTNNTVMNNEGGFYLSSSSDNEFINNTALNNTVYAMYLYFSSYNHISSNFIKNSTYFGIYLSYSNDNIISRNKISNIGDYGVSFDANSSNNEVKWNDFVNNNLNGDSQAIDNGTSNIFDYNYWNDHINPDSDSNMIVDTEYIIDGTALSTDSHSRVNSDKQTTTNVTVATEDTNTTTPSTSSGYNLIVLFSFVFILAFRRMKNRD